MAPATPTSLIALRSRRDQVIELLSENFARDLLEVEEFERRIDLAHRAGDLQVLDALVADLAPVPSPTALARPRSQALEEPRRARQRTLALMSAVERRGRWRVPAELRVSAVMGSVVLDFRECELPPGDTELRLQVWMGSVEILVPPDLAVECEGTGVMGAFEFVDRAPASVDPERPRLRISGLAVMGAVSIETRLPGETGREARRRRRHERRHRRDQARAGLGDGGPS